MPFVASQLIKEVIAHAQSDSLEDAREICADGTYFPNNLRTNVYCIVGSQRLQPEDDSIGVETCGSYIIQFKKTLKYCFD